MKKQKILVIAGPTGVGKTALSIFLAKRFNGEIVSADSIQIYKGLDIGSAKVTEEEKEGIAHHLIDIIDPTEEFSAADYAARAKAAISDIISRGKLPIIVGGSGMYISALLFDRGVSCGKDEAYRKELEQLAREKGSAFLHDMLKQIDPQSASQLHENHLSRIIRALEIYHVSGKKKSEQKISEESNYDYHLIALCANREDLYKRIDERVDKMLERGLVREVENLKARGIDKNCLCMHGIGYQQTLMFLNGELEYDNFVQKLKQDSRHYAKRQLTYFKKMKDVVFRNYDQTEDIVREIELFLKK